MKTKRLIGITLATIIIFSNVCFPYGQDQNISGEVLSTENISVTSGSSLGFPKQTIEVKSEQNTETTQEFNSPDSEIKSMQTNLQSPTTDVIKTHYGNTNYNIYNLGTEVTDGALTFYSNQTGIYNNSTGTAEQIASDDANFLNISSGKLYYVCYDKIISIDYTGNNAVEEFCSNGIIIDNFVIVNDTMYFLLGNDIYRKENQTINKINVGFDIHNFNVVDNNRIIATIYSQDKETGDYTCDSLINFNISDNSCEVICDNIGYFDSNSDSVIYNDLNDNQVKQYFFMDKSTNVLVSECNITGIDISNEIVLYIDHKPYLFNETSNLKAIENNNEYINNDNLQLFSVEGNNIVNVAAAEIGTSGRPNTYTYWLGPIGGSYSYEWCQTFASWCANQAGLSSFYPKTASCDVGKDWFINHSVACYEISNAFGGNYEPQAGDFIYYSNGHTQADSTHVGIVEKVDSSYVYTIEGNYSDSVKRVKRAKNDNGYIIGYGVPEFNLNSKPGDSSDNIEFNIEESYTNTSSGFHTKGWVIAGSDINRLTYSINGGAEKTYNNWLSRPDVNAVYPDYPQTPCGFKIDLNWSNFKDGKNTFRLKAYTNNGNSMVISDVYFNIAAPSGYSIAVDRNNTYIYNNDNNNSVTVSYTVSNSVECTAKLIVEKNGALYGTFDFGTSKSNAIAFTETGTYEIYFELSNSSGTFKGTKGNDSQTINVTKKPNTYNVTYNANGGTGAPANQTKTYGTNLTLSTTKPTRTGYNFVGWATSASATSAQYQPGGTYSANSATTLYAVWKKIAYNVTYNANGGTGAPANQTKTYGTNLTLSTTKPTRTGYTFVGWATSASATSAQYQPGGTYSANSATTLYAVWKKITYNVTYNANGGTGAPANQTKTYGTNLTLSTTKPTRTGYNFVGWATSASATSAQYQPGGTYSANSAATLYAVWKKNTYTITYSANGGTGAPANQTKTYGTNLTLSTTKPTRTGYTFVGWATSASATSAQYQPGGTYSANSNVTLYAVWNKGGTNPVALTLGNANGTPGGYVDVPVTLSNNNGISCFDIVLKYDNSIMYPVSYTNGNYFADIISTLDSSTDISTYNEIKFVWYSLSDTSGTQQLFTVKFKIKDTAPTGTYAVLVNSNNTVFTNSKLEDIAHTSTSAVITISSIIPDYIIGDCDVNGMLSANDSATVLQKSLDSSFIMNCETYYPTNYFKISDVNGDKILTANDAAFILQKALNSSFKFTAEM